MRLSTPPTWMLCLALASQFFFISLAEAGKNNGSGRKTDNPPEEPFSLQSESYYFRSGVEGDCLGEDDELEWLAQGTLPPGESNYFNPQYPSCYANAAAITNILIL